MYYYVILCNITYYYVILCIIYRYRYRYRYRFLFVMDQYGSVHTAQLCMVLAKLVPLQGLMHLWLCPHPLCLHPPPRKNNEFPAYKAINVVNLLAFISVDNLFSLCFREMQKLYSIIPS